MAKALLRTLVLAVAALTAACTTSDSSAPALSGPSGAVGVSPTALFTFSPESPAINSTVQFDASQSCVGPLDPIVSPTCTTSGTIVSYVWQFGDGSLTTGRTASHTFGVAQAYSVSLTVVNDRGVASTMTRSVTVGARTPPTVSFEASPSGPAVGTVVTFTSTSTPAPGRSLSSYRWDFGDTGSASGSSATHTYSVAGSYVAVLTVTDDVGATASTPKTITVGTGAPTASFVFAVTAPLTHTVTFDGAGSTPVGGATIATYAWSFGDGLSAAASASSVVSHSYGAAGTYTATLTVTDSLGRVGVKSQSITVP